MADTTQAQSEALQIVLDAAKRCGMAHNYGAGGQYVLVATGGQLTAFAAELALPAQVVAEPVGEVVTRLRLLGRDDALNRLAEDKRRLSLEERESIAALQTAALAAAQMLNAQPPQPEAQDQPPVAQRPEVSDDGSAAVHDAKAEPQERQLSKLRQSSDSSPDAARVLAISPGDQSSTQPPQPEAQAVVQSDDWVEAIARKHGTGGWQTLADMVRFGRAVLAAAPAPAAAGQSEANALIEIVLKQCGGFLSGPGFEAAEAARRLRDALAQQPAPSAEAGREVPQWIVNDLGELGVKIGERFFFLYKGGNIEYGSNDSRVGIALHDDGTPMRYRIVGNREFGETCGPLKWIEAGRREDRYTEELTYLPGRSFGNPEDGDWRDLPAAPTTPSAGGEACAGGPTTESMRIGGRYNWKGQSDRLIYIGRDRGSNGYWYQFKKIGDPRPVWCEVLDTDLSRFEETKP